MVTVTFLLIRKQQFGQIPKLKSGKIKYLSWKYNRESQVITIQMLSNGGTMAHSSQLVSFGFREINNRRFQDTI